MKKILAVLLSLALLMSLVPLGTITASAASPTVYVGNVLVTDGTYLPNGATKTQTTKPTSGGYAYLSGSTLTLNNYSYTGSGMLVGGGADCYTAVYANGALTVSLYGTNTLNMNNTTESYAIYCIGNLTVKEGADGGNLTIKNCTRGIENNGAISIVGGKVTIDAVDYGVYCRSTFGFTGANVTIKTTAKDGIYTKDALILSGNITITAKGVGISTSGTYGQSGGIVTIDAVSAGILSISTFKQTGGELYVTSDSNAVSSISDVTFSGGFFDIKSSSIRALVGKTVTFKNLTPNAANSANGTLFTYNQANIANYKRICYQPEVYVGGVGLVHGQYLATGSNAPTTTKPSGGYAHYFHGALILNNYECTGPINGGGPDYRGIEADGDLYIILEGDSRFSNIYDGIGIDGNLVIDGGDGHLTLSDITREGIYADDIALHSGKLTINKATIGVAVNNNVTITGGAITINSSYDGVYADDGEITISGGTINIDAYDNGIYASRNIIISGGTITLDSDSESIYSYENIIISGGTIDVIGGSQALYAYEKILIDGVTIKASTTKDGALVNYVAANNDTYKRVVTAKSSAPTYSVIFYFGGDPLFGVDVEEGKTVEEPAEPAQDCKTFLGWYLGGTKYDFSKPVTKDIVLVATFKENHTYSNACDKSCNVCGNTRSTTHSYKTTTTKATTSKNGSVVKKCSVCGSQASKTTIYYAKKIKLSTTKYTYNGKARKPSVTVYDYKGNKISSSNYTVSYASGCKYVGKYKVTIKFKSKYSGTLTTYFTIIPKESKVSSLTAGKKSLKVKLSKVSSQASGYEIQYSTSKKFTSAKTKKVTSYKTTSVTLKSLKAKKTYYVRVRTYKTVNGTKYYSGWSTYKYKKTK